MEKRLQNYLEYGSIDYHPNELDELLSHQESYLEQHLGESLYSSIKEELTDE